MRYGRSSYSVRTKALSIYDQMIAKFPEYASWTNGIAAGIADKAGKEDLGAQYNQKIVDELGNNSNLNDNQKGYLKQALRKLGYYYWGEKNNLDAAKPYYEEYISLVENKAEKSAADLRKLGVCYNYLAVYFIQNDQTAKAKEYAKKLQELQPDNDTAKQILAL